MKVPANNWPANPSALSLVEAYLVHVLRNQYSPTIAVVDVLGTRTCPDHTTRVPPVDIEKVKGRGNCGSEIERIATELLLKRGKIS